MHACYNKVCLHDVLKPLSNNYNLEDKIFPELILFSFFLFFYSRKHGKEENERRTCNQATVDQMKKRWAVTSQQQ
jgi:hypothetical protein